MLTLRYMLQLRLYYHAIIRRSLIKFAEHLNVTDNLVIILALSLLSGLSHFVLQCFWPPYMSLHRFMDLGAMYVIPCVAFFFLVVEVSDIHKHFAPLADLICPDSKTGEADLGKVTVLHEHVLKLGTAKVMRSYEDKESFTFYTYFNEMLRCAEKATATMSREQLKRLTHRHVSGFRSRLLE